MYIDWCYISCAYLYFQYQVNPGITTYLLLKSYAASQFAYSYYALKVCALLWRKSNYFWVCSRRVDKLWDILSRHTIASLTVALCCLVTRILSCKLTCQSSCQDGWTYPPCFVVFLTLFTRICSSSSKAQWVVGNISF